MKKPRPKARRHYRFYSETAVIEQRLVGINCSSIRIKDHYCLRDCIDNLPQLGFVLLEFFFDPLALFYVSARSVPPDDIAGFVAQWLCPNEKPTKNSIMAAKARLDLAWFS